MKGFLLLAALVGVALATRDLDNIIPDHKTVAPNPDLILRNQGKIIDGTVVEPNSIPYQVAIFSTRGDGTYFCGGSLISASYVLTAAHCLYGGVTSVRVLLGAHNIRETEATQVEVTTTDFDYHKQYNPNNLANDIAWIHLPTPVDFTSAIQTVTLPKLSDVDGSYDGNTATLSGWGKISDSASGITDLLRSTQAPVMEYQECGSWYNIITNKHVCTDSGPGPATCNGDSGGPLTVDGVQIGIVSFGSSLGCESGYPSAYTRVSGFLDWLEQNTDVVIQP